MKLKIKIIILFFLIKGFSANVLILKTWNETEINKLTKKIWNVVYSSTIDAEIDFPINLFGIDKYLEEYSTRMELTTNCKKDQCFFICVFCRNDYVVSNIEKDYNFYVDIKESNFILTQSDIFKDKYNHYCKMIFEKKIDLIISDNVFIIISSEEKTKFDIIVFIDDNFSNISEFKLIIEEIEQKYVVPINGTLTELVTNSYFKMVKDVYCVKYLKFHWDSCPLDNKSALIIRTHQTTVFGLMLTGLIVFGIILSIVLVSYSGFNPKIEKVEGELMNRVVCRFRVIH